MGDSSISSNSFSAKRGDLSQIPRSRPIHDMDPTNGDKWAEKQKAKVDKLPDGKDKDELLKMLDDHEGKGWTVEDAARFQTRLFEVQHGVSSGQPPAEGSATTTI